VLQIPAENLVALPLADSAQVRVGDFVVAVGNPFGLGQTVTHGMISALQRSGLRGVGYQNYIQTDAPINPGNSGGPLVNLRGELVGINSAIYTPSGGNVGIGFAIPVNLASDAMRQLIASGHVQHGSLGVQAQTLTPQIARMLQTTLQQGAVVTEVVPQSAGDEAGIKPGDVITAIDGRPVRSRADVFTAMAKHRPGDIVTFAIRRAGGSKVVSIRAARDPKANRAIVGIGLEDAVDIHVPIDVTINAGDVGGPSAGLAFALDILQELGRNIVRGHKIAATGEIFPDGSVGPIGGIKQKTIGAREAHVDAFLVPAGENAQEARRYAHGLKIIAVENFPQALRALATLR